MKYAVQRGNGQFTGVLYDQLKPNITAHHAQYGETLVPVARLDNTGTEDDPVWEPVEPSLEERRDAMTASRMQARVALHQAGLLAAVEAAVAEADPVVQIAWADATEFRRTSPTIATLAAALDPPLTDEQLDDLFEQAMQVTA